MKFNIINPFPLPVFDKADEGGGDAAAAETAAAEKAEAAAAAALAEAEAAAALDETSKDKEDLVAEKKALLADVMSKKAKLKETSEALAAAQTELAKFKGIDPAKYAALVKAEKDAEEAQALASGDFDRVKTMMAEQHQAEIAEKNAEIERLRAESAGAAKVIDGLTVGNDFASSKFIAEKLTLSPTKTRVIYGAHFESKDGKTVGYDKPAGAANRTLLVDSSGNPLPFEAAIEKIIQADPDKNSVLKANVVAGSGSKTSDVKTPKPDASKTEDGLYGRTRLAAHFFKDN